jgi:hypothetical protein
MIRKIIEAQPVSLSASAQGVPGVSNVVPNNTGRSLVRRRCTGGIRASYYEVLFASIATRQ